MDGNSVTINLPKITVDDIQILRKGDIEMAVAYLQKLIDQIHYLSVTHALLGFPDTIRIMFKNAAKMDDYKREFFAKNADLAKVPDLFAKYMIEVEAEMPHVQYEVIVEETARRTRAAMTAFSTRQDVEVTNAIGADRVFKGVLSVR